MTSYKRLPKEERMRVLSLGACHINGPLNTLSAKFLVNRALGGRREIPGVTYSFAEMLQMFDVLEGKLEIPSDIAPLCFFSPDFSPSDEMETLEYDVILVEPATPVEIVYRGIVVNLRAVLNKFLAPIDALGRDFKMARGRWFNKGVRVVNEELRAQGSEELLKMIPKDFPNYEFVIDFIKNAKSINRNESLEYLKKLQEKFPGPMGIVTYVFQYMPDGRPVNFPPGFRQEILSAANTLKLPVFEPSKLVNEVGVKTALMLDRQHFRKEFKEQIGNALYDFMHNVVRNYHEERPSSPRIEIAPTEVRVEDELGGGGGKELLSFISKVKKVFS